MNNEIINDSSAELLENVMDSLPPEPGALSPGDTLNVFRSLNRILPNINQRNSFKLAEHQNFPVLRQAVQSSLPYVKIGEIIDVFKVLRALNVPLEHDLTISILSNFRSHSYDMSLHEIMLLDSFLRMYGVKKTNLANALQRDLVSCFNLRTSRSRLNFSYFDHMRRMIRFINLNWRSVDVGVLVNISKNSTNQTIDISTAEEAMKILMELSRCPEKCKYYKAILEKAFAVWNSSEISIDMVEKLFQTLAVWRARVDKSFNDEQFIDKCVQKAIESNDIEKCFSILSNMNRLNFASYRFLEYLFDQLVECNLLEENAIEKIIAISKGCDIASYMPNSQIRAILLDIPFQDLVRADEKMNWPRFAVLLNNIGVYHQPLIDAILKDENQFHYDNTNLNNLKKLEALRAQGIRHDTLNNGLASDLRDIIGTHRLLESVRIDDNFAIQFLLKVNILTNSLTSFEKRDNMTLSHIERKRTEML